MSVSILIIVALFILTFLFGMALMPKSLLEKSGDNLFAMMLAPLLGCGVWLALTVGFGAIFKYNIYFLSVCLVCAGAFILLKKDKLVFPKDKIFWIVLCIGIIGSCGFIFYLSPREIDGGLYFYTPIYDHVKSAIVDSIASNGLPPKSPWLADDGSPVLIIYYYAFHALAAQISIFTGASGYLSDVTLTGFNFLILIFALSALAYRLTGKKIAIFCLLFLAFFNFSIDTSWLSNLPSGICDTLSPPLTTGFWGLPDNNTWVPQHIFSGSIVILAVFLYSKLLESYNKKESIWLALLIGILASAAFTSSVFAGIFALLIFTICLVFVYIFKRDFRIDFNRTLPYQILTCVVGILLSLYFIIYLFKNPPESNLIAFGLMLFFEEPNSIFDIAKDFFSFYFWILPLRIGFVYIVCLFAIFIPKLLPDNRFIFFGKILIVSQFLIIFVLHSTVYSNDFGWRTITSASILLPFFATILLVKFYEFAKVQKPAIRATCYSLISIFLIINFAQISDFLKTQFLIETSSQIHKTFAKSKDAWEIIRKNTDKNDLVLCNPQAFKEMCMPFNKIHYTNIFFSLYARRNTPIADLIFAKCYSEFYKQEKLENRFNRVSKFFNGATSKSEIDYLADELKVKAILITPYDAAWQNEGDIKLRYPILIENLYYKIYLSK